MKYSQFGKSRVDGRCKRKQDVTSGVVVDMAIFIVFGPVSVLRWKARHSQRAEKRERGAVVKRASCPKRSRVALVLAEKRARPHWVLLGELGNFVWCNTRPQSAALQSDCSTLLFLAGRDVCTQYVFLQNEWLCQDTRKPLEGFVDLRRPPSMQCTVLQPMSIFLQHASVKLSGVGYE